MSILAGVRKALEGVAVEDWQRALAEGLAGDLDGKMNASMAAQLRALMVEIGVEAPAERGDVSDDLAAKRKISSNSFYIDDRMFHAIILSPKSKEIYFPRHEHKGS